MITYRTGKFLWLILLLLIWLAGGSRDSWAASNRPLNQPETDHLKPGTTINLKLIGRYSSGVFDEGAVEIVAHDPTTQRLFATNGHENRLDLFDFSDPTQPRLHSTISLAGYGAGPTSVAVYGQLVAVSVVNQDKQAPGTVVFFNTSGQALTTVTVGPRPDMLTFTPNGQKLLVANEGEPDPTYTIDPEGSISIIDLSGGVGAIGPDQVHTADFTAFQKGEINPAIRIFGPNANVAQDLEPEYITVSADSKTAWVSLQENNALAIVDLEAGVVTELVSLGFKDFSREGNGLDASDRDGQINITTWPVKGMYQPDGLAAYQAHGQTYILSANEGDSRRYADFREEDRVRDLSLDHTVFSDVNGLRKREALGRLKVSIADGDPDIDGKQEELFAYGARSFSIWNAAGELVFDSGDDFAQIIAAVYPDDFNATNDENDSFDNRSDDQGSEPEGVTAGVINGRTYAFIGLERMGGVMVYDVSEPTAPTFVQYVNTRNFKGDPEEGTAGDVAPEGLIFIPAEKSPNGKPLLVVAYEVSGTIAVFEIGSAEASEIGPAEAGDSQPAATLPATGGGPSWPASWPYVLLGLGGMLVILGLKLRPLREN